MDYGAMEDWSEVTDAAAETIWGEWMKARRKKPENRGVQAWSVVPKNLLFRVWESYAELGFIRDEAALDDIAMQMVINAAKLYVNTTLMGHTEGHGRTAFESMLEGHSKEEIDRLLDGFEDFVIAENGQWRISDRIDKIANAAVEILAARTPVEKLTAIDILLNIAHQRSDLAASFIEGGSFTLSELSETGTSANPEEELPRCFPPCGASLHHEGARGRDTETMGGREVEYFVCPKCKRHYERVLTEDPEEDGIVITDPSRREEDADA